MSKYWYWMLSNERNGDGPTEYVWRWGGLDSWSHNEIRGSRRYENTANDIWFWWWWIAVLYSSKQYTIAKNGHEQKLHVMIVFFCTNGFLNVPLCQLSCLCVYPCAETQLSDIQRHERSIFAFTYSARWQHWIFKQTCSFLDAFIIIRTWITEDIHKNITRIMSFIFSNVSCCLLFGFVLNCIFLIKLRCRFNYSYYCGDLFTILQITSVNEITHNR